MVFLCIPFGFLPSDRLLAPFHPLDPIWSFQIAGRTGSRFILLDPAGTTTKGTAVVINLEWRLNNRLFACKIADCAAFVVAHISGLEEWLFGAVRIEPACGKRLEPPNGVTRGDAIRVWMKLVGLHSPGSLSRDNGSPYRFWPIRTVLGFGASRSIGRTARLDFVSTPSEP